MYDWVRVLDMDGNVIYMNKAMRDALGRSPAGTKCYNQIGRSEPCDNCISRKIVFDGACHEKEEIINGRVFSVMSSPIRNEEGKIIAAVEVLRDTTQLKQLYHETQRQNEKFKAELEMARKLQVSLLPESFDDPRIEFAYIYAPCGSLGGDFIDIFMIDGSHVGFYLADVSGHGVPASLLTVFLRSSLDKKQLSPAKALEALYYEFNRSKLDEELYITMFYAIIDLNAKKMLYSNAGLCTNPLVYGSSRFEILRLPGIPISNWVDKPAYANGTVILRPGDKLFLYSDGILEMRNKNGEQFGDQRLFDIILNEELKSERLLSKIRKSAFRFAGIRSASQLPDDVTLALLKLL